MDALVLAVAEVIDAGYAPATPATAPTVTLVLTLVGFIVNEFVMDGRHSLSVA
jgi:hypothetical protein